MKVIRKRGDTSNILQIFIQDSSSTTGAGLTGLVFNTASLVAYYHKDTDTTATAISLVTMTVGTFTSSGFKEIDATNMPGWYQFCPPDAALSTSGTPHSVAFHLKGATNMAPLPIECQLIAADVEDAVRFGLTAMPNAAAGASGGLLISGSNSGTTTLAALTVTGALTVSDGIAVTRSSSNTSAITATGNGTGSGIVATSGLGATGDGIQATAASTNGNGFALAGTGTGDGLKTTGGATGNGFELIGGGTSGDGLKVTTTVGHGFNIAATGTSKHGITSTGGTAGTSDGFKAVAGTGGVDIRGNITGNLVGTVSTLTTYTGNTVQTGDGFARLGAPAGASVSADVAAVKTDTAAVKVQTDKFVFTGANKVDASVRDWVGDTIPARNVTGVPIVDLKYTLGTISPATAGSVRADSVTGAVGSVTGAVGSVTGNVGGNVTGSVASVVARVTANADQWAGGTIPAPNVTGVPLVDLKYTLGTISPATAGSVRADLVTGAVGSVTGAVGSVTGAVGSVTGNVGGNVVGSVASVAGAVGSVTGNVGGSVVGSVASVVAGVSLTSSYDFAKGTVAMTESYAADGVAPTPVQALFLIQQKANEMSISSTTMTVKKIDGVSTAAVFQLDSATAPTSITRTT